MSATAFSSALDALGRALTGSLRPDTIDTAVRQGTMRKACAELCARMRAHAWLGGGQDLNLKSVIEALDTATRAEGFHVLHDWNGKAEAVTPNTIAVDVLDLVADHFGEAPVVREPLAIALDYYFLYALALLAMRSWDQNDAGASLDAVTDLVCRLQGPSGSGQRFADNAETLLLIATSHYEPNERGYDLLLTRARALPVANRTAMALTHAQAMGGHLRFGYEVTYGKDFKAMRDDNGADYPWLLFGLAELMEAYDRLPESADSNPHRDVLIEALINGLTPDPTAVLGRPVSWFAPHRAELDRLLALLAKHRASLIAAADAHRPRDQGYSPIALFFNFSQNVLKGAVADACVSGRPSPFGLNDLFSGLPRTPDISEAKAALARRLTAHARVNPDTIRGRLSPVIVYDPVVGRHAFGGAVRALKSMTQALDQV